MSYQAVNKKTARKKRFKKSFRAAQIGGRLKFWPCGTERGNPWHFSCKNKRCRILGEPLGISCIRAGVLICLMLLTGCHQKELRMCQEMANSCSKVIDIANAVGERLEVEKTSSNYLSVRLKACEMAQDAFIKTSVGDEAFSKAAEEAVRKTDEEFCIKATEDRQRKAFCHKENQ